MEAARGACALAGADVEGKELGGDSSSSSVGEGVCSSVGSSEGEWSSCAGGLLCCLMDMKMSVVTMRRKQKAKSCHSRCRRQSRPTRRPSPLVARASGPMSTVLLPSSAGQAERLDKHERRHLGPSSYQLWSARLQIIALVHSLIGLYISTSNPVVGIQTQVSHSIGDSCSASLRERLCLGFGVF